MHIFKILYSIPVPASTVTLFRKSRSKGITDHSYINCRWLGLLGLLGLNGLRRKEGKRYSTKKRARSVLLSFT